MRRLYLLLLALASQQALATNECMKANRSIAGISIGAKRSDLIAEYGPPRKSRKLTEAEALYESKIVYPDARAYFADSGKLVFLESFRKNKCTASGVCPGTGVASARQIIGGSVVSSADGNVLSCSISEYACDLVVLLKNGVVNGIRLQCLP